MSTFEDRSKEKDLAHAAAMDSERKQRKELESLILSLQHNYNAGQQPNLEANIIPPHTQLEGPVGVSAGVSAGPPESDPTAVIAPDTEMRNGDTSREETRPILLTTVTEQAVTASNAFVAPITCDDAEMDTSQTNSKWHLRSRKEARYLSVHTSDENDPDFPLDDDDDMNDMNLVSLH